MKKILSNILLIIATIISVYVLYNMFCKCNKPITDIQYIPGDTVTVVDTLILRDTVTYISHTVDTVFADLSDSVASASFKVNAITNSQDTAQVSGDVFYSYPDSLFWFRDMSVIVPRAIEYITVTKTVVDTLINTITVRPNIFHNEFFWVSITLGIILFIITLIK